MTGLSKAIAQIDGEQVQTQLSSIQAGILVLADLRVA